MARNRGTASTGHLFSEETVQAVWDKGRIIKGFDPNEWRRDCYGKAIQRSRYSDRSIDFGWEIDHIVPVTDGGNDALGNLQPLQWEMNRDKGDQHPWQAPLIR